MSPDYTVEVDNVDKDIWLGILQKFDDASLYQTWSYGAIRWGKNNLSHLVLKKNGDVVAAAQVIIIKIPLINSGMAFVKHGPLWQLHNKEENTKIFHEVVRALRNEYVSRRHLLLRILPKIIKGDNGKFFSILTNEGFKRRSKVIVDRTLLVDLSPSIDNLRKGLNRRWRNRLNCAEKNDLEILEGNSTELYDMFISIYKEMYKRKKFVTYTNIYQYRLIQKDLPDDLKMKITVCKSDGKLCSAYICSAIGNTGYLVLGATNNFGRARNGSFAINWKILEWLKKGNYRWFDLGGINPVNNPGVYHFKVGFSGRNGRDVQYLGQFDVVENLISFLCAKCIGLTRLSYRKTKEKLNEILHSNIRDIKNFGSTSKLL